jgi:hypothetical protein
MTDRSPVETRPRDFALIIGAMKSATTSLFDLLSQHPEIAVSSVKEPGYFERPDAPEQGWDEYLSLWTWDPEGHAVALEASTSYSKVPWVPGVPERIAAAASASGASFRFIYVLRHPLRRIESQVRHSLFEGWGKTLDQELTQDLIDYSRYAMQIDEYLKWFPRESILVLTLEDLKSDPDDVLRRTCAFLGVSADWEFVGQTRPRNTGDFYQVPGLVGRLAKSGPARLVIRMLPSGLHHALRSALGKLGSEREDTLGRWQLDEDEEERVWAALADDLRRLHEVYGIDVRRLWSVPASVVGA